MRILRFITIFITCALFATSAVASSQMACCAQMMAKLSESSSAQVMPCHPAPENHSDKHSSKHESKQVMTSGCQCIGGVQAVVLPEVSPAEPTFFNNSFAKVIVPSPLRILAIIETPPKSIS